MRGFFLLLALACLTAVAVVPSAEAGFLARPGGAVVFSFDDGCATDLVAARMLEDRGFRGTFFLPSALDACDAMLTPTQAASLAARGHDVQSHTVTHADLRTLTDEAVGRELRDSQAALAAMTGTVVRHLAYPYGSYDARVQALTAAVYASGRSYYSSYALMPLDTENAYDIPAIGVLRSTTADEVNGYIEDAVGKDAELVIAFHSVRSAPRAYDTTPEVFGAILDHVKAKGYTVVTYAEALRPVADPAPAPKAAPAPEPAPAAPPPPALTFAPRNGNEWWVQVAVSGADASKVGRVEAKDTGGPWVPLPKKSWGDHAASFHVERGHLVTYRATLSDGRVLTSCEYAHPKGGCASGAPAPEPSPVPTAPAPSSSFTATFKNVRGNVWWVESNVASAGGTLAGVDARVESGTWVPLDHKSWGSWAKSIRAPEGSSVEFRARATNGATATSASYAWPP